MNKPRKKIKVVGNRKSEVTGAQEHRSTGTQVVSQESRVGSRKSQGTSSGLQEKINTMNYKRNKLYERYELNERYKRNKRNERNKRSTL